MKINCMQKSISKCFEIYLLSYFCHVVVCKRNQNKDIWSKKSRFLVLSVSHCKNNEWLFGTMHIKWFYQLSHLQYLGEGWIQNQDPSGRLQCGLKRWNNIINSLNGLQPDNLIFLCPHYSFYRVPMSHSFTHDDRGMNSWNVT